MRAELIYESAADDLKDKLPSLKKIDYSTIDNLMQRISKRYKITGKKLHDLFVSKYGHTPDTWIKKYKEKLGEEDVTEEWSQKYKSSINCSHPKGFSQKAHCAGKKKHNESVEMEMVCEDCGMCETHGDHSKDKLDELKCWSGYHRVAGTKAGFPGSCAKNKTNEEVVAEGSSQSRLQPGTQVMLWLGPRDMLPQPPRDDKKYWDKGVVVSEPEMMTGSWQVLVKSPRKGQSPISPERVFVLKQQGVAEGEVIAFKQKNPLTPNLIKQLKALSETALELFWEGSYVPTAAQGQIAQLGKNEEQRIFKQNEAQFKALGYDYSINEENSDLLYLHSQAREAWYEAEKPANMYRGLPDLVYNRETNTLSYYDLIGDDGYEYTDNTQFDEGVAEEKCPHCNGPMFSELMINEKKDACYYKVKSRYKVWPSAYASGALVKCRKKGADSWGNKSESIEEEQVDENLRDWFTKEKWVRMDTKGNIKGPCAREPGEGKPKCLPQAKAHSLGKKGRASAAQRKRREDPNPERSGKAINVNTKKKTNESFEDQFEMKINQLINEIENVNEDWQKVNKSDNTDGMSRKAVKAYRRENPGSKLKTAVTTKPSKLKKGSKSAKRRKSFCARMKGMKKAHASAKTKRNPDSPINKALRRWNCESVEQMQELVMIAEQKINEAKNLKQQAAIATAKKKGMKEGEVVSMPDRSESDKDFAIYQDGHPVVKFKTRNAAMEFLNMLQEKYPKTNYILKAIPATDLYEDEGKVEYILYTNGKPAAKYLDPGRAKGDLMHLMKKFPNQKFEIKQEVCKIQPVITSQNLFKEGDVVPFPKSNTSKPKKPSMTSMQKKKAMNNRDDSKVVPIHQKYTTTANSIYDIYEEVEGKDDVQKIKDFINWSLKTLNVQKPYPKFKLSKDTDQAQKGHHTGVHSGDTIWVYIGNRNLVDIFRTIFHELVHHRQDQLDMIKNGDSYPGSPIEALADMMAGKYIKIYGKDHPEIFQ